jgi:hypothetical protein
VDPVAEPDELAARLVARLVATLDDDPAYERQGVLDTSPWGSGQWVKYTDPDGEVHYLWVIVQPHRPG